MTWNPEPTRTWRLRRPAVAPLPTVEPEPPVRTLLDTLHDLERAYLGATPSRQASLLVAFEATAQAYLDGE